MIRKFSLETNQHEIENILRDIKLSKDNLGYDAKVFNDFKEKALVL